MATIVKFPGKKRVTWQAKVRRKGTVQNRTFHTKREAEDWARSIENAIAHDQYEKLPTHNHTVGELIDLYVDRYLREKAPKTQDTQGRYLQWWKQNLGDTTLMNINPSILEDYIQVLRKKGYAASTVNGFINALSPAFTLAVSPRLNWLKTNPFIHLQRLNEGPGRAPTLTHLQIKELLSYCDASSNPHLGLFCRVALGTGARKQELLRAKWSQVNFKQKTITFLNTKGKRDRTVPLSEGLVNLLRIEYHEKLSPDLWWVAQGDDSYSFTQRNSNKATVNIHGAFNKAREKAGLPWLRPHDLRHVAASRLAEAGADIASIADILGHKSLKITERYRHMTPKAYAPLIEKMGQELFAS